MKVPNAHPAVVARLFALLASITMAGTAAAELLTFDVSVDQSLYNIGDIVEWQVTATVSESTTDNHGTAGVAFNLSDSAGETLVPGTIGTAYASYQQKFGGITNPSGDLEEVGVLNFAQTGSEVAQDGEDLGPLLLASGSFTVTQPGTHVLSATAGSTNGFYTVSSGGLFGNPAHSAPYTGPVFSDASFDVAAVPEPSSCVACAIVAIGVGLNRYRRRRRRASRSSA